MARVPLMDLNDWRLWLTFLAQVLLFLGVYLAVTVPASLLGAHAAVPFRVKRREDWLAEYAKRPATFMGLAVSHVVLSLGLVTAWAGIVAYQTNLLLEPPRVAGQWLYWVVGISVFLLPLNLLHPNTRRKRPSAFTGLVKWSGTALYLVHLIWPSTVVGLWGWLLAPVSAGVEALRHQFPWVPYY
jgi:hypothetical protein